MRPKPPFKKKKRSISAPQAPKPLTAEERAQAVATLNSVSIEGYGDARHQFSAKETEAIMKTATRNLLMR